MKENGFEDVVCKMPTILYRRQYKANVSMRTLEMPLIKIKSTNPYVNKLCFQLEHFQHFFKQKFVTDLGPHYW